jgi:glutaminyl-peptide cyclotransferase
MLRRFWFLALTITAACGASAPTPPLEVEGFKVTAVYPHDARSFTQGLFYLDGYLYESTGLEGRSTIAKTDVKTGNILKSTRLPAQLFGEGIVNWGKQIISITWKTGVGFRWSIDSLTPLSRFTYRGEGWGLTQDGTNLIMSDGTAALRFLDPQTFAERKRIRVTLNDEPLADLNELEWVKGQVYANVWQTNVIVVIDPASGVVTRVLDMSPLVRLSKRRSSGDVLNGIAYDPKSDRLWITGKNWPTMFELKPLPAP